MKIALAQFNPVVGDIAGNVERMAEFISRSAEAGADLVVFGELSVVGYPPRDLLRKEQFVLQSVAAVEALAARTKGIAALVGFVRHTPVSAGRALQNAAALLVDGTVRQTHVKMLLPSYDVFDETRYFEPGRDMRCIELPGAKIGLSICEDLWDAESLGRGLYETDPIAPLVAAGADLIINMAASPFEMNKPDRRESLFSRQAARFGLPVVFVNQVGGNDELIFDGRSCAVSPDGRILARAKAFEEDLLIVDLAAGGRVEQPTAEMQNLSGALKLGLRDYVRKCGFERVVLGLSGGIDSAVLAVLAAGALGPSNVTALAMPSRFSSDHSLADAKQLAENLGIEYREIPIEPMHAGFERAIDDVLSGGDDETAAENIQARIRGSVVMAWSNAFGHLPLATGNKSELAVGYCTLYGDMCGGLAPIGDVLKTQVYELARRLNADGEVIPQNTLTKPPSAELKPDQTDQDNLPPYDVLDEILRMYLEQELSTREILKKSGFDAEIIHRVVRMVDLAEYKRQQVARVLKVSPKAFGMGRRMPIAQRFVQRQDNQTAR